MPLTPADRRFLQAIDRLKIYLLGLAVVVFLFLLYTPPGEIQLTTSVVGLALCGVFWLTQRLLTLVTLLDLELTKAIEALKRALPEEQRRELLHPLR